MTTDIGNQFDALWGVYQGTTLVLLGQRMKIAALGHAQTVPYIEGPLLKQDLHLAPIQRFVEISRNRKLTLSLLQLKT